MAIKHNVKNVKELLAAYLNGENTPPIAITPTSVATAESCAAIGVNFRDVHRDPDKMAALAAAGHEILGFDSVAPYFSVVQEAAALGGDIDWGDDFTMPSQRGLLFDDPSEFSLPRDFTDRLHTRTVIEAVRMLKKKYGDGVLVIGKAMGPWTLSYHFMGMENFLINTIENPDYVDTCLDAFCAVTAEFAGAQLEAGADIITIADHATRDLVSPESYRKFLLPVHKRIIRQFGNDIFILHCCGNTLDRVDAFREAGFKIFHFDSKNDLKAIITKAGPMRLSGCVNNVEVLLNGSEADADRQSEIILNAGIKLLSPECAVPLRVGNANLKRIPLAAKSYGNYC
jgi:[methyl-Co(III) methanol-specific corrinoid protein]:coenzyme M methyltransferase